MELEQQVLEAKLRQQKIQSDLDNKWREQEESNLRKRLSASGSFDSAESTSSEAQIFTGNNLRMSTQTSNVFDKDRSSTPNSSGSGSSRSAGSDDKPIVVKGKTSKKKLKIWIYHISFAKSIVFHNLRFETNSNGKIGAI